MTVYQEFGLVLVHQIHQSREAPVGFVSDVLVEMPEGKVSAIVVPGPCKVLGVAGRQEDFVIPWGAVCRIGPDIVLVDTKPEECRVRRSRKQLL